MASCDFFSFPKRKMTLKKVIFNRTEDKKKTACPIKGLHPKVHTISVLMIGKTVQVYKIHNEKYFEGGDLYSQINKSFIIIIKMFVTLLLHLICVMIIILLCV